MALQRNLPRVALIGAQAAARSALLAAAFSPVRPTRRELRVLQEMAALDRVGLQLGPRARLALAGEALAAVERLFHRIGLLPMGAAGLPAGTGPRRPVPAGRMDKAAPDQSLR
ncbi:hypothetical protein [Falsiroseomonas sp.]|uniref:hypothetical protein n=1 Tax=Falsiroseomonas sp. TaxID=2870721 RepID=UPI003566E1DF